MKSLTSIKSLQFYKDLWWKSTAPTTNSTSSLTLCLINQILISTFIRINKYKSLCIVQNWIRKIQCWLKSCSPLREIRSINFRSPILLCRDSQIVLSLTEADHSQLEMCNLLLLCKIWDQMLKASNSLFKWMNLNLEASVKSKVPRIQTINIQLMVHPKTNQVTTTTTNLVLLQEHIQFKIRFIINLWI